MDHMQLRLTHETTKRRNREKFENNSKKRLIANITKKFQTTMIGALSQFEAEFGYLWGMGNSIDSLTQEQRVWYDVWQKVRTEILNNGNSQLRACLEEIAQYTMTWNRYQTQFIIRKD